MVDSKEKALKLCQKARAILTKASSLDLESPSVVLQAGELYIKAGELDNTIAEPFYGLAVVLQAGNQLEKAKLLLQKASQLEPDNQKVKRLMQRLEDELHSKKSPQKETTQKMSFIMQLKQLKGEIAQAEMLFYLIREAFHTRISPEDCKYLLHIINTGESSSEDNQKVLQLLTQISPLLSKKPIQFIIKVNSLIQDLTTIKRIKELNEVIQSPQQLFKVVERVFNFKLSKSQATVMCHLIHTGTINGDKLAGVSDWFKTIHIIDKIVPGKQNFTDKWAIFVKEIVVVAI